MLEKSSRIQLHSKNIQVFIRIRPFSQSEPQQSSCISVLSNQQISIKSKQSVEHPSYVFDHIYQATSGQQQIYKQLSFNIIQNAFNGINGTIFCYGQTSSGKTYTCIGKDLKDTQNRGILPRTIQDIMARIQTLPKQIQCKMKISMIQIYNQKLRDLLDINKTDLKIRSDKSRGIFIENVTEKYLLEKEQAYNYISKGIQNRSVGFTQMNALSSRSHVLFIISIHQQNLQTGQAIAAKVTLVDLAGSEKMSKTGIQSKGKQLEEAKKINTSLSALGKVINILSQNKNTHVPYRDSKLTRLLQQSLGGNCITKLIINVSPSSINQHETQSSLRFGFRAKSIKNQPRINKQHTVPQLLQLLHRSQKKVKLLTDCIKLIMKEKDQQNMTLKQFIKLYLNNNIDEGYVSQESEEPSLSLMKSLSAKVPHKMQNTKKSIQSFKYKQKSNPELQQLHYQPKSSKILKTSSIKKPLFGSGQHSSLINLFKSINLQTQNQQSKIQSARTSKHFHGKSLSNQIGLNEIAQKIYEKKSQSKISQNKNLNYQFSNCRRNTLDKLQGIFISQPQSRKNSIQIQDEQSDNQQLLLQDQIDHQKQQNNKQQGETDFKINQFGMNTPFGRSFIASMCTFNSKVLDLSISGVSRNQIGYKLYDQPFNRYSYSDLNQSCIPQSSSLAEDTIQFNIASVRDNLRKLRQMHNDRQTLIQSQMEILRQAQA